jgi:GT2 family glycosyltransferase/tetratricopeptide (TPR) repeat protein
MARLTAILTAYRRPETLRDQLSAIREQTAAPQEVWLWANQPRREMRTVIKGLEFDRVVTSSRNAFVHARFALALTAPTEFVAIFDDDTIPGRRWLENCWHTFDKLPGILGSAGVRLHDTRYASRSVHGWHHPETEAAEVDLVGHAWFLKTEWVHYLFSAPPVTGTNGEDIELSARAWRLAGIHTYCPPHPSRDRELWGSLHGVTFGDDAVALSRRPQHLEERDRIVRAEIAAGWEPLFLRREGYIPVQGHARRRDDHDCAHENGPPRPKRTRFSSADAGDPPADRTPEGDDNPERFAWEESIDQNAARTSPLRLKTNEPLSAESWEAPGDRTVLRRVHVAGYRALLIGHDVGEIGRDLKGRRPSVLTIVEMDRTVLERTRELLGDALSMDEAGRGVEFDDNSFDVIIAPSLLERVRRPEAILRRLQAWLAPDGRLIATFRSVRSLPVVEGLLAGRWLASAREGQGSRPLRFFTRREVEKLLSRARLELDHVEVLAGPRHTEWVDKGRPGDVKVGRLHIGGLAPDDVEEFYAQGFLIEAKSGPECEFGTTSIVIVTHNQLEYTRTCVESIRRLTDEPYELIFVDNASTDGTVDYLKSLPGALILTNDENRGFPEAANQGIEAAGGSQVLLLNNDTIVTTGWLRRLLVALHSDPKIGLVGPCSNFVGSTQQIEANYDSLTGMDGFAWEWGKLYNGRLEDTDRLIGFCLLIRRTVIDEVGLLDEQFGIGCFEDDDYCLRAIKRGWRAVIARDTFVHHFGGRTFVGTGVDFAAVMRENEAKFRTKWQGSEEPAPPALPTPNPSRQEPAPSRSSENRSATKTESPYTVAVRPSGGLLLRRKQVRLSLCMIVRDNARTLPACLESIYPWVDELVIVDTGSHDETPTIAQDFGARLFHFPWCDDFSAARNESLRHARGEWLFWMDSDDTITPECGKGLRELAYRDHDANVLGHVIQVHCPGSGEDGANDMTAVDHVKLIRNRPDLRFDGRIHEQILPAIRRAGGDVAWSDLYVVHSGSDHSEPAQERKRKRDLHLLHLELRERPNHPFTLFNLGMTYADARQFADAEDYLHKSIANSSVGESHLRKAYALLVFAQMQQKRFDEAHASCRTGLELFPRDAELRFREGVLLHELGRLEESAQAYLDVLGNDEERHFSSVDSGLKGFKARQNLAVVYTDMGDLARAERQWRQVVRDEPGYRPGWRGLGEVLLRRGKVEEACDVADELMANSALESEGIVLQSRIALHQSDPTKARTLLERALKDWPEDLEVLRLLCQVRFEHGSAHEAEQALRELIDRDPTDASAHHNLGTLLLRAKYHGEAARAYRQSLHHRPDSAVTYLHLGYALKESGKRDEAVAAWKHAIRLAPDNPAALEELRKVGHTSSAPADSLHGVRG